MVNINGMVTNRRAALFAMAAAVTSLGANLQPSAGDVDDEQIATKIQDERTKTRSALNEVSAEVTPAVYRATEGDQTVALQAFLDDLPVGRDVEIRGIVDFTTVTINRANIRLRLAPGAVLNKIDAGSDGITINAANVTIEGGKIKGPAAWNGRNTSWTYAMVHVKETTANNATIRGVTLENIHKVGIGVRADAVNITDCRIVGNYPAAQWTGVETAHLGIALDPTAQGMGGAGIVSNNHISGCVQGLSVANYGSGRGTGYTITGNSFYGCYNHGIYSQSGVGNVISGNAFSKCQVPVVITGAAHVISGNTLYTTGTGGSFDMTGLSIRDAVGCVVEGNTIFGDSTATNSGIGLDALSGTVVSRNIIKGNVLVLKGSGRPAIRVGVGARECTDNVIEGNLCVGGGQASAGVILLTTASSTYLGSDNMVVGNRVSAVHKNHGIYVANQINAKISGNLVSNGYNASSLTTLVQIYLDRVSSSAVTDNELVNPASAGIKVALRGVQEDIKSTNNVISNIVKHDKTRLASSTATVKANTSSTSVCEEIVGNYATAHTLGRLIGKLEVRSPSGAVRGWVPVYRSIT
ncbi:hypothetical protein E7744_04500 [Citricoccus sp. SGAir0253]|uniref:right-handed parallel beta-helix repeat-containing protein n=1 Tax=Citricoccus sp. SGAir0253 TaxID=2567881 RepID=UPI0010CD6734|nr:right-handed parallel beta-helix repeat-containing protein [Citricoccus sp. SGAir0253]QCU77562.1 hypothetical protein E7744_04500 [Citricoccus sp. SGAir0253]